MYRLGLLTLLVFLPYRMVAAQQWQPVSPEESVKLREVVESAYWTHWERGQRGWCRGTTIFLRDEYEFACWWDKDRVGLEVSANNPGTGRDPRIPVRQPHVTIYTPGEEWTYTPGRQHCEGNGGILARRLLQEFDMRPQKYWLSVMGGSSPKLGHMNLLRFLSEKGIQFQLVRSASGLVAFENQEGRLVFDPQQGFSPILYENNTEAELRIDPKRSTPLRESYELAQDRHGEWYCRKRVRTVWPHGLDKPPLISADSEVLDYDSRPTPEMLRLTFESLKLPEGTRVESTVRSRPGTWVVGREKEGQEAVTEERFRQLGKTMRTRGFAQETTP